MGDSSAGGGGLVALAVRQQDLLVAVNIGGDFGGLTRNAPDSADLLNLEGGGTLTTALGLSYRVNDALGIRTEINLDPSLASNDVPMAESPGEWMVSVRGKPQEGT